MGKHHNDKMRFYLCWSDDRRFTSIFMICVTHLPPQHWNGNLRDCNVHHEHTLANSHRGWEGWCRHLSTADLKRSQARPFEAKKRKDLMQISPSLSNIIAPRWFFFSLVAIVKIDGDAGRHAAKHSPRMKIKMLKSRGALGGNSQGL